MSAPLRPYQLDAVAQALTSLSEPSARPMLQLPTGAGKTKIAAAIIGNYRSKGLRVAFVVPYISIVDQTISAFERDGLSDIGVVQAKHPRRNADAGILVCSKDTLRSRSVCPDVNLVVIDEAHIKDNHLFGWMENRPDIPFLGLSATPWARGLGRPGRFTSLIKPTTPSELIDQKHLVKPRVFVPSKPNLAGVKISARTGDYDETQLSDVMRQKIVVGNVVEEWKKRAEGRPTFVFAVDRGHAKELQREFEAQGVSAAYIDARTPREERAQIIEQLRQGIYSVVINIRTLVAGVDAPFVSCICYVAPTLSAMQFVQAVGRGLRPFEGKTDCLLLDHADATSGLGMVDTIDRASLDDSVTDSPKPAETKGEKTNLCPVCTASNPDDAVECWHCGHVLKHAVPDVSTIEGELKEYAPPEPKPEPERVDMFPEYSDALLFGQLRHYGNQKRYSPNWAKAKFKKLRGKWPGNFPDLFDFEPEKRLMAWIMAENAEYARSMRSRSEPAQMAGHQ